MGTDNKTMLHKYQVAYLRECACCSASSALTEREASPNQLLMHYASHTPSFANSGFTNTKTPA